MLDAVSHFIQIGRVLCAKVTSIKWLLGVQLAAKISYFLVAKINYFVVMGKMISYFVYGKKPLTGFLIIQS